MASGRVAVLFLLFAETVANHYKTLGVPRESPADAIKAAYRKIALQHHPDRVPKTASGATRQSSQRKFEEANGAFEVLSDPTQRRQYDFEMDNPIQQREDGTYARGEQGRAPTRPKVEVTVPNVNLQQLGGWEEVSIPLDSWTAALGATVSKEAALANGLPLRLYLPPGSKHGDGVPYVIPSLGPQGVDIIFRLAVPQDRRWERRGDDLRRTLTISAWHRMLPLPVRLVGVDGEVVDLPRGPGKTTLAERGMPVKGTGDNPRACTRGDLHVTVVLRPIGGEVVLTVARAAGVVAAGLVAHVARVRLPVLARSVTDTALGIFDEASIFLTNEVFGRFTPNARRARQRGRSRAQAERASRKAEREAERARNEREKRARELEARFWMPLRRRVNRAWVWAFDS